MNMCWARRVIKALRQWPYFLIKVQGLLSSTSVYSSYTMAVMGRVGFGIVILAW